MQSLAGMLTWPSSSRLVERHVLGSGWGYRGGTDLPRRVMKSVEKELRRLERKLEQRRLASGHAS